MKRNINGKANAFVYGYYGLGNLGDDLLIKTLVDKLTSRGFAGRLYIRNMSKIESLNGSPGVELTNLEYPLFAGGNARFMRKVVILLRYINEHRIIFKQCHSFVLGGGTLISQNMSRKSLFILSILVALARLQGLRVIGLGLGITRIHGFLRRLLARFILRSSSKIFVRDEASLAAGECLSPLTSFPLASDLVFSSKLTESIARTHPERNGVVSVGFTLVEPFLRGNTKGINRDNVFQAIAESIEFCLKEGFHVKLIGFQNIQVNDGSVISDVSVFDKIISIYGLKGAEVIDASNSITNLVDLYNGVDVVVGMRYHSLVLSALSLKPFVGFSCDHKVYSLCNSFEMPCIDMINISGDSIISALTKALGTVVDVQVLDLFRARSELNFVIENYD